MSKNTYKSLIEFTREFIKDSTLSCEYKYKSTNPLPTLEIDYTTLGKKIKFEINDSNIKHSLNRLVVLIKCIRDLEENILTKSEKYDIWKEVFFIFWRLERYFGLEGEQFKDHLRPCFPNGVIGGTACLYYIHYGFRKKLYDIDSFKFKEFILEA